MTTGMTAGMTAGMTGAGARAKSEDMEAAERYLAGPPRLAAGGELAAGPGRRPPLLWRAAGAGRRLGRWLAARSLGSAPRPRRLSVVERLDLGPKKSLWLVACGEQRFLVAAGAETIGAVREIAGRDQGQCTDRIPVISPARWMAR